MRMGDNALFPPACGGARGGDRREPFCEDIYNCSTIGYRLSATGYRLSAIGYRLSAIGYRLPAIGYRLSAIGYRLSAIFTLVVRR